MRCCALLDNEVHRSLHDWNRFLLSSFIKNNVIEITNESDEQRNSSKSNRIFTDVGSFMESVCINLKTMYPSTTSDFSFINQLFHRYMTSDKTPTEPPP